MSQEIHKSYPQRDRRDKKENESPNQKRDGNEWDSSSNSTKTKTNNLDKYKYKKAATGNDNNQTNIIKPKPIGLGDVMAKVFQCSNCQSNFKNKGYLVFHEKKCKETDSTVKESFFKQMNNHLNKSYDTEGKVSLPDSQEPTETIAQQEELNATIPYAKDTTDFIIELCSDSTSPTRRKATFAEVTKQPPPAKKQPLPQPQEKTTAVQQEQETNAQAKKQSVKKQQSSKEKMTDLIQQQKQEICQPSLPKPLTNPPNPPPNPPSNPPSKIAIKKKTLKKKTTTEGSNNKSNTKKVPQATAPPPPQATPSIPVDDPSMVSSPTETEVAYEEIVKWRRNLFTLPKGNNGKKFVEEMTRLINHWSDTNEEDSLKQLMIMPSLLLQRTAKSCKARENKEHLRRRFEMWENKQFGDLVEEGKSIQRRLAANTLQPSDEVLIKQFRNHMLRGNINAALRLLNNTNGKGLLPMNEETIRQLHDKHPKGEELHEELLLKGPIQRIHPVIFDKLDAELVQKTALKMRGAAGPSGFDADDWRSIIGSRALGSSNGDLCTAIAKMARTLCSKDRTENGGLSALVAGRLIPLDKDPGLRPIGIGEVLRRIIGKMVVYTLKPELQEGGGELQMCVGQEGGCEAGVHAMHQIYNEDETHGIIQVDANNAFNTINRNVFLHNIQVICPEIATYIRNCYLKPARLFVIGGLEIASDEGTTQGDPTAMPTYALGILPLLLCLAQHDKGEGSKARQAAYADDLTGGGKIEELRIWWDLIIEYGPHIGYYAKPSKSWLIVKPEHHEYAKVIFAGSGLQITTEGKRHLGAVIGTEEFKNEYLKEKIDGWIEELKVLETIAKVEPHIAYSAYVKGFQSKFTYVMRTIPNIEPHLERLDNAINQHLIKPILNNYNFSRLERVWFSLPPRLGGLGINILSELGNIYYENSKMMTTPLVQKIINQHSDEELEEGDNTAKMKAKIREEKQKWEARKVEFVKTQLNEQKMRVYEAITEKGASNWLNALPLKEHDFYLNKQTFWDTIYLRYGIPLTRMPTECVCAAKFDIEHALNCKKGGFVIMRHNDVRDFTADLLSEVCNDVAVEPLLTPLTGEKFKHKTANVEDNARLDVSARGVWIRGSRAFVDIKVFNPLAKSYSGKTLKSSHRANEKEKKRAYEERILMVEHGSFTPLVFSCLGGMSVECAHFFNQLADKYGEKQNWTSSKARTWVRTKLNFCLLRSTHLCIRGSRTKRQHYCRNLGETNVPMAMEDAMIDELEME